MMTDLTLFIDTTTNRLMLALGQPGRITVAKDVPCDSHRYHSALMIPAIEAMLRENDLAVADLKALAVNIGPGSFTGIRTGLITARTMAQFLDLPVYCFNTFELLAAEATDPTAIYLDALRGRSYTACLSWTGDGAKYWRQPPGMTRLDENPPDPPPMARLLVSPGLEKYFPWTKAKLVPGDFFSPHAMAVLMARYGRRFARRWPEVHPLYLQEPSITLKKA
jgi:tRNA threonylcarbamoyl adenosine modification protein YeaZ